MRSRQLTVTNKLGLHARASAKLVSTASRFQAQVALRKGDREVNGKSIMGIMMLAASKGTGIEVITNGADEVEAMEAIAALINNRFGEIE